MRRTTGNKLQTLLLLGPVSVDKGQEKCGQTGFSHAAFCPADLENADSRVRLTFVSHPGLLLPLSASGTSFHLVKDL